MFYLNVSVSDIFNLPNIPTYVVFTLPHFYNGFFVVFVDYEKIIDLCNTNAYNLHACQRTKRSGLMQMKFENATQFLQLI